MGESRAEQAQRALRQQDERRPVCRRDGDRGGSPVEIEPGVDDAHLDKLRLLVVGYFQAQQAAFPSDRVRAALEAYWRRHRRVDRDDDEPPVPDDTLLRELEAALREWTQHKDQPVSAALSSALAVALHLGLLRVYRAWFTHFDAGQVLEPPLTAMHRAWAQGHADELLDQIDETTRTRVLAVIRRSIGLRRSADETVSDVSAFLTGNHAGPRPALIAQTETLNAYHRGALEAHRELKATEKAWRTWRDKYVCGACAANEAQGFIPLDSPFQSGHQQPLAHPNCRCWLVCRGVTRQSVLLAAARLP